MRVACAVVFCVLSFCYLFFYQADLLTVEQHILSKGKTTYQPFIGAVLITTVLYLLQLCVFTVTRLYKRAHAMTYFPSVLFLLLLTVAHPVSREGSLSMGPWLWLAPILLVIFCWLCWFFNKCQPHEPKSFSVGFLSRITWINMLTMAGMFLVLGLVSNHNNIEHYKMRTETLLLKGKYDDAWRVGSTTDTDSSLVMLRAYSLAKQNLLGEHLFELPLVGGSHSLRPDGETTSTMIYPQLEILRFAAANASDDYRLCAYLLDKDLVRFVQSVQKCYNINNSKELPKHYQEALTLYMHKSSNPVIDYKDPVLEADYSDFQQLERNIPEVIKRKNTIRDVYGNTYWYYYKYVAK